MLIRERWFDVHVEASLRRSGFEVELRQLDASFRARGVDGPEELPSVHVLELHALHKPGLRLLREIAGPVRSLRPVLVLGVCLRRDLILAAGAGAVACLVAPPPVDELVCAVELARTATLQIVRQLRRADEQLGVDEERGNRFVRDYALSATQVRVLECWAADTSYKDIARELAISPDRVRQHIRALGKKLGVSSVESARRILRDESHR